MTVHAPAGAAPPRLIRLADLPAEPWRNGGGLTQTLLVGGGDAAGAADVSEPAAQAPAAGQAIDAAAQPTTAAAAWRWRLSLATIHRDGPFSAFPGITRWLAVVQGQGVRLRLPQGQISLQPGDEPLCFDGADAPGCALLDGPTHDLNLMLRGVPGSLRLAADGDAWTAPQNDHLCEAGLYTTTAGHLLGPFPGHWRGQSHGQSPDPLRGESRGNHQAWPLPAHSLLWFDTAPPNLHWQAAQPGLAWWVTVQPHLTEPR